MLVKCEEPKLFSKYVNGKMKQKVRISKFKFEAETYAKTKEQAEVHKILPKSLHSGD